jgi:renalase
VSNSRTWHDVRRGRVTANSASCGPDEVKNRSVAVIGAGVAGLAGGSHLARACCDVVVFEKARGVGGRTSTRRSDAEAFDHGAQYFTCRSDAFAHQVDDWCRRDAGAVWSTPIVTLGSGESTAKHEETRRYVGVPGMSALGRDLAKELRVECGQRIARLEGSAGCWNLIAEQGPPRIALDTVVVAVPAPQAVPLLAPAPRLAELVSGSRCNLATP